jgi:hypothetical protein
MTMASRPRTRPANHFVHLGDRLLVLRRMRAGMMTAAQAASSLGVTVDEIRHWQQAHAGDAPVSLEEFRARGCGEAWQLRLRAKRLAALIAEAERTLRELNHELLERLQDPSKELK